jgi:hypothetical protein
MKSLLRNQTVLICFDIACFDVLLVGFKTGLSFVRERERLARCLSHKPAQYAISGINRRQQCFGRSLDIQASGLAQGAASWSNFERLYHAVDYRMTD